MRRDCVEPLVPAAGGRSQSAEVDSDVNLMIQVAAIVVATALRLGEPGYLLAAFVITFAGPLLLTAQLMVAVDAARRRPRLPKAVGVPFVVAAGSLVAANVLIADGGYDSDPRSPLEWFGCPQPEWVQSLGWAFLGIWVCAVVWALIANGAMEQRTPPVAG
jgi:hypothetical protein